ncbi:MAG TPA: hypothetical protein VK508_15275 [Cyclobacteriaceae bacterium]|nr:hypothetical protein [Cyclobacteriaceae bacterium]
MYSTVRTTCIALSFLALISCAKVFSTPDAAVLAHKHKTVAIIPPTVSIAARKKVDAAAILEQQKTESLNFQREMHSWLLKRKMQGKISPEIQDVVTTNALLKRAGYPETPIPPGELCEILGVDGVITSNYAISKPMSEGGAVALGLLFGVWGATNEANVSMDIHDGVNNKLIWNYSHKYSGSIGSSPGRLVDGLMRNASKKMPYVHGQI